MCEFNFVDLLYDYNGSSFPFLLVKAFHSFGLNSEG